MKPHRLRRWKKQSANNPMPIFTCSRPGRSLGPSKMISDCLVLEWVKGLQELTANLDVSLISLLGKKKDGTNEYSFYDFKTSRGFQRWLKKQKIQKIHYYNFPTCDMEAVAPMICKQIGDKLNAELRQNRCVIIYDSGGMQRTGQVCREIGLVEDTRIFKF